MCIHATDMHSSHELPGQLDVAGSGAVAGPKTGTFACVDMPVCLRGRTAQ